MPEYIRKKCEHGKRRSTCIECGGSEICEHGKRRSLCIECGGSGICEHGKRRSQCIECGGSSICEHGKQRSTCIECGGSGICEHNKERRYCIECGGSGICEHKRQRRYCVDCSGNGLCKLCHLVYGNRKYDKYCLRCFIYLFPDQEVTRNYKTKERAVHDQLKSWYPNYTIIWDKKIDGGCSRRRPDFLIDFGAFVIIVEVDENQHEDYNCSCDNKRLCELSQDTAFVNDEGETVHRPMTLIRFNPDDYMSNGKNVTSCWGYNKLGVCIIKKSKVKEWITRLNHLKDRVDYWIASPTNKTIEVDCLFFDVRA